MGATSPATAKTTEELGLPPRFEDAMYRRLGQTGIFVEVNGKYYLNEARLAQMGKSGYGWEKQGMGGRGRNQGIREKMFAIRIIRMVITVAILLLIIANFFYFQSREVWLAIVGLIILAVIITLFQIYYMSKARKMHNISNF